jgi:3D-(3,5/4)-trihydroxycyclohexane-1,2-dione acylhydrolase (decyclizing)
VNPQGRFGGSGAWWEVPVAGASTLASTAEARAVYEQAVADQRHYL